MTRGQQQRSQDLQGDATSLLSGLYLEQIYFLSSCTTYLHQNEDGEGYHHKDHEYVADGVLHERPERRLRSSHLVRCVYVDVMLTSDRQSKG